MRDKKAMVLLSGGLDSSTCLGLAIQSYGVENVHAVSIKYGQRHLNEIKCAKNVARHYKTPLHMIDLTDVFAGASCSLLKESPVGVPHGSYQEQKRSDRAISTYVPFRNGLMVSVIASKALSVEDDSDWDVVIGVHKDDMAEDAYPDCSVAFVSAMNHAVMVGTRGQVSVVAPFVDMDKSDIVRVGLEINVPYELTWSCYEGGDKHCGECATCIDRRKAFEKNNATDPVPYKR